MEKNQSHDHHYVPQWYQRGFMHAGQKSYFYLDLKPEKKENNGFTYVRRDLLPWSPRRCFFEKDLYTLKLGPLSSDQIEKKFFGLVDSRGREAVNVFANYSGYSDEVHGATPFLPMYMGAQRFRTPAGLDFVRSATNARTQNHLLMLMQYLFQAHSTMWMEGVWEIVHASTTSTKFIVSDQPVTFFNRKVFPRESEGNTELELVRLGTRTLFPLNSERCLIITHLQMVRNPWKDPLTIRTNARAFQPTMRHLLGTQYGRELIEDEVLRINYILKRRASRYIAAADEEWLYPERILGDVQWSKLDDDWFLLPNPWKVSFSSEFIVGYEDGSSWAMDEYGRQPFHPKYKDERRRDQEWESHQSAKREWALRRKGKSLSKVENLMRDDEVADRVMQDFLDRKRDATKEAVL